MLVTTVGLFQKAACREDRRRRGRDLPDSTGEPPFIRSVYEWWGPEAEGTGAALLTAFGHDHAPACSRAHWRCGGGPGGQRVDVSLLATGRGRRFPGTAFAARHRARTRYETATALCWGSRPARLRMFEVDGRPRQAVSIGASEQFALPRRRRSCPQWTLPGWFGTASGPDRHVRRGADGHAGAAPDRGAGRPSDAPRAHGPSAAAPTAGRWSPRCSTPRARCSRDPAVVTGGTRSPPTCYLGRGGGRARGRGSAADAVPPSASTRAAGRGGRGHPHRG